jgi:hypothetical protein
MPASIPGYSSGPAYKLPEKGVEANEHFDGGGEFRQDDQVPLIAHFSLRHGFMESKFSVTAASESLTVEVMPQWTLMTLSHEIMHSRVRAILQALFGKKWDEGEYALIRGEDFEEFRKWIESRGREYEAPVATGLRNAILNFCYAIEMSADPVLAAEDDKGRSVSIEKLSECYTRNKQLAIEIVVHFHDYYFAYACQPKMYAMSLWASWIKVAAPFQRTSEYLARSLATIAGGTGLEPIEAFNFAVETLQEALDALEARGVQSPLFGELRRLTSASAIETTRAYFKPFYYLSDQVRLFFASQLIASRIDRLETDPFAEGSTSADDYSANIYVYGESGPSVSPVRYALAALFRSLSGKSPIADNQWLTAWNYLVISS